MFNLFYTVFSGLTACFPVLFSSFQHINIYGKWVPGVCFTDSFLALFSLALRLVFQEVLPGVILCFPVLVPGFSIVSTISGVGSWILFYGLFSGFTACFLFGLAVSACHRDE